MVYLRTMFQFRQNPSVDKRMRNPGEMAGKPPSAQAAEAARSAFR